jgi:glutamine synthetase
MTHDELLESLTERGIERVKVGAFDIDGILRGKYMSLEKFASALGGGFGFCDVIFGWDVADVLYGSASVTGWDRGFPDAAAVIDPSTLRDLPWELGVAAVLADFRDEEGNPHPACPRSLLKKMGDKAASLGFEVLFACEFEFFFFKETPETLEEKGYRGLEPLTPGMFGYSWVRAGQNRELMADIMEQMSAFDIEIEGLHTETGPGVLEAAIRYDTLMRAADKAALFKVALKQIAHEHGLAVTFMAKHNAKLPGCSGHLHQSLVKDGDNVFYDPMNPGTMSTTLRHYLGGMVELMPELTAMVSPTINSYKRYVPGVWAPLSASWGVENRTAAARIIGLDSPKAARVEFRQGAADINPYLAMAACLGAGLHGVENAIEPPEECKGDATYQGRPLPKTLEKATELFAKSAAAAELFGEGFVKHYAHTRRWEVQQYETAVTDWELKRYFECV